VYGGQGGTASSLSGEGYLGRHKGEDLSPNTEKSQVLQYKGWSIFLLARLLWFVFSNSTRKELHPSRNFTHPHHLSLPPSGSWCTPDLGCTAPGCMRTSPSGAPHPLSGMVPVFCGAQKKSCTIFGVSGDSRWGSEGCLHAPYFRIETPICFSLNYLHAQIFAWADFGCYPLCQKETYLTALYSFMNLLLSPGHTH